MFGVFLERVSLIRIVENKSLVGIGAYAAADRCTYEQYERTMNAA